MRKAFPISISPPRKSSNGFISQKEISPTRSKQNQHNRKPPAFLKQTTMLQSQFKRFDIPKKEYKKIMNRSHLSQRPSISRHLKKASENKYTSLLDQISSLLDNPLLSHYLIKEVSSHDDILIASYLRQITNKAFLLNKETQGYSSVIAGFKSNNKSIDSEAVESSNRLQVYQKCFDVIFNLFDEMRDNCHHSNSLQANSNNSFHLNVNLNVNTIIEQDHASRQKRKEKKSSECDEGIPSTQEGTFVNGINQYQFTVSKQGNGIDCLKTNETILSQASKSNFTEAREALKSSYKQQAHKQATNISDIVYEDEEHSVRHLFPYHISRKAFLIE